MIIVLTYFKGKINNRVKESDTNKCKAHLEGKFVIKLFCQRGPASPRQSMLGVPSSVEQSRTRLSPSMPHHPHGHGHSGAYRPEMVDVHLERERERQRAAAQERALQVTFKRN